MPLFVGCDLGTMGTKAAVVADDGAIVGEAFEEVSLRHPRPGWAEQDLGEIEASAHRTIRAALHASGGAGEVAGVAFSGQMSGIGAVDDAFVPAVHFDSWLDTRCAPYIAVMAEHADEVVGISGCPPTYSHGPKILWWQHERPEDYRRIARFVVPGAFVAARLCGLPAGDAFVDRSYLHFTNLADTQEAAWSEVLLDRFDVNPDMLPRIVDPLDVVGEVTPQASATTGIPAGTPVAAGAGDTTASALGAGVVAPGQVFDAAGTASVLAVCVDRFAPDVSRRTLMAAHGIVPGTWIALAFINGGGLALRWFRDALGGELAGAPDAYARLDAMAAEVEPGAGGLLWYPHLQGRVLPPAPEARGAWVGVTSGHTPGHLYRAILEGIAFEYAEWAGLAVEASGTTLTEARVLGGGAGSRLWNQIKADVVGIDWVPTERQECGVLGDALIAAAATGHIGDLAATAQAWQQTREPVAPDPAHHARYRQLQHAYHTLDGCLGQVYEALAKAAADAASTNAQEAQ